MKTIKNIKNIIFHNFGLKTLSVVLALLLWLIARINS